LQWICRASLWALCRLTTRVGRTYGCCTSHMWMVDVEVGNGRGKRTWETDVGNGRGKRQQVKCAEGEGKERGLRGASHAGATTLRTPRSWPWGGDCDTLAGSILGHSHAIGGRGLGLGLSSLGAGSLGAAPACWRRLMVLTVLRPFMIPCVEFLCLLRTPHSQWSEGSRALHVSIWPP
jgi:hypothetical protein